MASVSSHREWWSSPHFQVAVTFMESLQYLSITPHPSTSVVANSKLPEPLICCFFSIKFFFTARVLYKPRINLFSSNSLHVTVHLTSFQRCLWMTCFLWISYSSILSGRKAQTLTLLMIFVFSNQNQSTNQRTALAYTINTGTKLITLFSPPGWVSAECLPRRMMLRDTPFRRHPGQGQWDENHSLKIKKMKIQPEQVPFSHLPQIHRIREDYQEHWARVTASAGVQSFTDRLQTE